MPPGLDRDEALRRAEKLLRQGRLDAAIDEYARIVDAYPNDFPTLNALGDLYVRAARSDLALPLYLRVADRYHQEGFLSKAAGFYKKILKFTPDDDTVLLRLAEVAAAQGLLVEARSYLKVAVKLLRARGDLAAADTVAVRLGALDPHDLDTQLAAARARARVEGMTAVPALREVAAELDRRGRQADAVAALRDAAMLDPADVDSMVRVVRADLDAGRLAEARAALARLPRLDSAPLLELLATLELLEGRSGKALEAVHAWLEVPGAETAVIRFACDHATRDRDGAWDCLQPALDRTLSTRGPAQAALALEAFAAAAPGHVPTLMRLVEVCVEGDLQDRLSRAQAALADAYLDGGRASEARLVAEDLASREPGNAAHQARVQRALDALGQRQAVDAWSSDAITDAMALLDDLPARWAVSPASRPAVPFEDDMPVEEVGPQEAGGPFPSAPPAGAGHEADASSEPLASGTHVEVDLTAALNALASTLPVPFPRTDEARNGRPGDGRTDGSPAPSLDEVFAGWRHDVLTTEEQTAARDLSLGETFLAAGMNDDAQPLLESAARDRRHRFRAALMLARLHDACDRLPEAIDWLGHAADAPGVDTPERFAVLRQMGDLLERGGEWDRAVAVWLEAHSLVPDPEIAARIERLTAEPPPGGDPSTR